MSRLASSSRAALGTIVLLAGAVTVQAQEQGTATPPPAAPAAETAAPATAPQTPPPAAATTPSTTTAPAAGAAGNKGTAAPTPAPAPAAETPPAQGAEPSAATPPPAGQTPAPTAGDAEKLPDVEIIQTQPAPTPEPVQPDAPPPPKVAKKKPPVTPDPQPVAVQAKPKAAPEPQPAPEPQQVAEPAPQPAELPPPVGGPPAGETLVKMSPVAGSEIPLDKVPGAVGTASAADVARNGTGQVQNVLQQQVPGIILSDTAGSGFRTDVSYRGFDASPIGGRSQALAVYMNGIRINESFGDTVNFDAIPSIAISNMAVVGNNPVFGLNAIGGAISVSMKDGFEFQGATIDAMAGSFGRKQIAAEAGAKSGAFAAYAAAEYLEEDGFRDFSAAEVKRMFADVGFKGGNVELHFSFNGAKSLAGVVTAAPFELLALDYGRTFTNPQDTEYEVLMPSLRGSVKATDTLTISGLTYYRRFKQNVLDGNLSEVDACAAGGPNDGLLCLPGDGGGEEVVQDGNGNTVSADLFNGPLGSLERITQDAKSYGTSAQAVEKSDLFGRPNQFLVGVSYDHGKVAYQTSSELGTIGDRFVVTGSGIIVVAPDDLQPRDLVTENDYYGVFFSNTLDVTDQLAITVGGRYNHATIKLTDLTGDFPELNTTNKYDRFNPMIGATYKLMPGLSVYGGYSEANRAPTAAELGCAEPTNPCLIESFLTDDPPLKQVVSHSWEAGLRGEHKSWDQQKITWSLGYFRTLNTDDILNVAATTTGRGFFLNAGDTLRQGVEAAIGYQNERMSVFASYALVDATFQTDLILSAPNTPGAPDCPDTDPGTASCNFVQSGDSLPGIPKHRFKAGIEYWLTPQWKIGSDLVAASDQFFFGDEANNNAKLAGYSRIDLKTSYDLTENVQIYGSIKNLFDKRYGLYGTFFDPVEATEAAEPQGITLTDPRSQTPAQPFAIYGGVKVKF